jgi:Kef-type K+ transport system membrane component KefB
MALETDPILQAILAVSLLLFGAKLLAELFARFHLPVILGELGAGMLLGPLYFAGLVQIQPSLIEVNDIVLAFAEIGAIVILFVAGLELPFREFVRGGKASFTVGGLGVLLPFLGGFLLFSLLGRSLQAGLMVGAALTATSIAISIETLRDVGRLRSPEGKLVIGAAVVDDVLAIAVLSVVISLVTGGQTSIEPLAVIIVVGSVLILFAMVLVASVIIAPRLSEAKIWKTPGSLETVLTALFFGMAAVAAIIGLSPIVGSFAVGMALAGANVAERMRDYVGKLEFIFRPLFFAVIGSQVNLAGITWDVALIGAGLILVAVVTKLVGCGFPASYFLKSRSGGRVVGIAMISRGEVGLIVAGLALASGAVGSGTYAVVVLMVVVTTILAPLWLKRVVAAPVSIESIVTAEAPRATNSEVPEAPLQAPP